MAKQESPSNQFDVIVIGGGHNGLTAAAYLAKSGKKVLLAEQAASVGGLARSNEFAPGFTSPGVFHDTSNVRQRVIQDLQLRKFGLAFTRKPAAVFAPSNVGPGILLHQDANASEQEIAQYSPEDAQQYRKYRDFMNAIRPFFEGLFDAAAPPIFGLNAVGLWEVMKKAVTLRLLGSKDMLELLRIGPMCVADYLNEWFATDLLKALIAAPAVHGNYTGPWSPSTNANLLIHECMSRTYIAGGPQALVGALVKACDHWGVQVQTSSPVRRIMLEQGVAVGVELATGDKLRAGKVIATCDPKQTFLELIDPALLPQRLEQRALQYRARGVTAKVNIALSEKLTFSCRPSLAPEFIKISESLDEIERSFDPIKYGQLPQKPSLDICASYASNDSTEACTLSILVHYVPYDLRGGWSAAKKEELLNVVINRLVTYAPTVAQHIVASEVWSPVDLEKELQLTNGHLFHGEHATDQLLARPSPESAQYLTPIANLYLGGSGSHPGGGITCGPGSLAARAVLAAPSR